MRRLFRSILNKSGATQMPQPRDEETTSGSPASSGGKIDQYRLEHLLGKGHASIVYFAALRGPRCPVATAAGPDRQWLNWGWPPPRCRLLRP